MATSEQLRRLHENMRLNGKSKHEDAQIAEIIRFGIIPDLMDEFGVRLEWEKRLPLKDAVRSLRKRFPNVAFADPETKAPYMSPDGGITYLVDKKGRAFPILIGEVKNQGTNDKRAREGLKKQSKGNAVERLGKNVIGFRTYMIGEGIFPFVCFGDGCDFAPGSSILDRVLTVAMFGALNTDHTASEGPFQEFNRGSYYFREKSWTAEEIYDILTDVARKSIFHYFSKYGDHAFR